MDPMLLLKWAGAVILGCVALLLAYGVAETILTRAIFRPLAKRRHLKALKAFSVQLEKLRKEGTLVSGIPADVLFGVAASTLTQEQISKKPPTNGNGQS